MYWLPIRQFSKAAQSDGTPRHVAQRHVARAEALGARFVARVRYELDARRLPADLRAFCRSRRLTPQRIGSTTYRSSTWALVPQVRPQG